MKEHWFGKRGRGKRERIKAPVIHESTVENGSTFVWMDLFRDFA